MDRRPERPPFTGEREQAEDRADEADQQEDVEPSAPPELGEEERGFAPTVVRRVMCFVLRHLARLLPGSLTGGILVSRPTTVHTIS